MKVYSVPTILHVDMTINERLAASVCEKDGLFWTKIGGQWYAYEFSSPTFDLINQKPLANCAYVVYSDGLNLDPPTFS